MRISAHLGLVILALLGSGPVAQAHSKAKFRDAESMQQKEEQGSASSADERSPSAVSPAATTGDLSGTVTDPQGSLVAHADLTLVNLANSFARRTKSNEEGDYEFRSLEAGDYRLTVNAPGFVVRTRSFRVVAGRVNRGDMQFVSLAPQTQQVTVVASEHAALTPDPSQRILLHEDLLEANPGRPGGPISIPGLPVETASGGIKAPQYFAPGVAGDHGEPIAQFFLVGEYLFPNNLPANAHGNGYADPNFLISRAIGTVETDGGAFNVREGNHAVNLPVAYGLRPRLEPLVQFTGDSRDTDLVVGWDPRNPNTRGWIALEGSYGNGFLGRLERRKQLKLNGYRVFTLGRPELTLFTIGYYGFSRIPGLLPIQGFVPNGTIDSRQLDRTHTTLFVLTINGRPPKYRSCSSVVFSERTTSPCAPILAMDLSSRASSAPSREATPRMCIRPGLSSRCLQAWISGAMLHAIWI